MNGMGDVNYEDSQQTQQAEQERYTREDWAVLEEAERLVKELGKLLEEQDHHIPITRGNHGNSRF